jgi:hypothetical protein
MVLAAGLMLSACEERRERPPEIAVRVAPGPGEPHEYVRIPDEVQRPWEKSGIRQWIHYRATFLSGGVPPLIVTKVQEPNGRFTVHETIFPKLNDGSAEAEMVLQTWSVWFWEGDGESIGVIHDHNPASNRSYPEGSPEQAQVTLAGDPVRLYHRSSDGGVTAFTPTAGRDPIQGNQSTFLVSLRLCDPRTVLASLQEVAAGTSGAETTTTADGDLQTVRFRGTDGLNDLDVAGWTTIGGARWPTALLHEVRDPDTGELIRRADYQLVVPAPPLPY